MIVNPLFVRLGVPVPADVDTLAGLQRLVNEHVSESRHLDFKRQLNNVDDLADDLSAMANVGGGVLIIGIGTDKADCAVSLHDQDLHVAEQQVVQAARDGIDEPLRIEPVLVPGSASPSRGFVVVIVPPSDRTPHISVKKGRVLHRVGTHNKPMTRRELGAAFAAAGDLFAIEFGLARGSASGTAVVCELINSIAGADNTIKVANTGAVPVLDISIDSTTCTIFWDKDVKGTDLILDWENGYVSDPPYLPIRRLPSGSDVVLRCRREWNDPTQDVLQVTWKTPDGQLHRNEQSWSWRPR
jgi:Putative DNA-binding domain